MRHRLDPRIALDPRYDVERLLACRAACAIRDGHIIGLERMQFRDCFFELRAGLVALRREELKAEKWAFPVQ